MQGPVRIGEMRPRERAQIGAAGGDDAVHVIGIEDRPHRHGGDAHFVADPIGERRLVHPAIDRLRLTRRLARRHVDQISAGLFEQARDHDRVVRRVAAGRPVVRRYPYR